MKQYITEGFNGFSRGTMGDAGNNIYVSHQGRLQRIFRFDTTNSGYTDVLITNSHDYNERPPLHVISDPLGQADIRLLLTEGAKCAAVADLNGDGCDDLVIGMCHNGHHTQLPAYIYYGGPEGLSENRKIEVAAPGCECVAAGDFDGDGFIEIAFLIEGGKLRLYRQNNLGFLRNAFTDYNYHLMCFEAADLDADGCCDLYCRGLDGSWFVLWGGKAGFSETNRTVIGVPTDDGVFNHLPAGGGNLTYKEHARPKILRFNQQNVLLFCGPGEAVLYAVATRQAKPLLTLAVPRVISAAAGHIMPGENSDLVLLSRVGWGNEKALIFLGNCNNERPWADLSVKSCRDVLIEDFGGCGYGSIVICQGRDDRKYSTHSPLYPVGAAGIGEPRSFKSHNAIQVLAADTIGSGRKQLLIINHQQSSTYGHVPVYIYTCDRNGFAPDRRFELHGHSPGTLIPADFNDDGNPDLLLINNGEDQPFLDPPSYIFWGNGYNFTDDRKTTVDTHLAWGGQVADINRDGWLDIVSVTSDGMVMIHYGSAQGYRIEDRQVIRLEGTGCLLWPTLADFNRDGWLDLFIPCSYAYTSIILWGGPDGYSLSNSTRIPVDMASTSTAADLNGNGWLDLIVGTRASQIRNASHQGSLCIFWGGPDGFSSANCCELPCYEIGDIAVADYNNDGFLDIAVSCYFNARERDIDSYIYWNDQGRFSATNRKRLFAHSSSGLSACDYNEDGYVDLLVTNHRAYGNHNTDSAIWWNGPNGFTEEQRTWLPTIGPHDTTGPCIGNIRTREMEEEYYSEILAIPAGAFLSRLTWEGEIPAKTWVAAQLRSAESPGLITDALWSRRFGCNEDLSGFAANHYVQYKLILGAINGGNTPLIMKVILETT